MAVSVLGDLMGQSTNQTLPHASETFSQGRQARAARLSSVASVLLTEIDVDPSPDERLRVEAVLREIDASFAPDAVPEHLAAPRAALVARLGTASDQIASP